jgi:hypothetical protein
MSQKEFVLPTFGVTLTDDLETLMTPLALAIAIETGQLETIAQERRSAFVELMPLVSKMDLSEPRLIKDVLADEEVPQHFKDSIEKTLQGLRDGSLSLS